ncbi:hypothetical protein B9Z19DRAFT_1082522 [Tuber borchii]|uniref:Uncharacterized protein n=1 Tax=Tuber borchii TaxID=42251 RepID=A0A2T6ZUJ2_TUBBO|nr:hypothetical protein B9Z19DRAFT_1082522 [Tuber borchii]
MRSWSPFMTAFYAIPSIPGALGMRSQSPFPTAFYAIQSTHSQKGISIQPFSMALQSSLKGESLWRAFLALTL